MPGSNGYNVAATGRNVTEPLVVLMLGLTEKQNGNVKIGGQNMRVHETVERIFNLIVPNDRPFAEQFAIHWKRIREFVALYLGVNNMPDWNAVDRKYLADGFDKIAIGLTERIENKNFIISFRIDYELGGVVSIYLRTK